MRAALISLAAQPRDGAADALPTIAGKTLAQRQLEFALAAGCEQIIALGDGSSHEAIALSHFAEAEGAQFQAIGGARGLLGIARSGDELLVLAPGLLPESREALAALGGSPTVLVLAGPAGTAAGFERIDLNRAWAGALIMPAALIEKLAELPPDAEPAAGLLRIALQGRVKERALAPDVLANGAWAIISPDGAPAAERAWLERNLPRASRFAPADVIALAVLRAIHGRALGAPGLSALLAATFVVLLIGAVLASWLGHAAIGFAVLAAGVVTASFASLLGRVRHAPLGAPHPRGRRIASALVDLTLTACGALAIGGSTMHQAFPPLALAVALQAQALRDRRDAPALLADRSVLAVTLAIATAAGCAEPAIMLLALALIGLGAAKTAGPRG